VLLDAVRAAKPDAIRLNARLTGFDDDGTRVTVRLADGTSISADSLVGADGVHSRVRNILAGDDRPQFTGCMAWRGLVPVDKLPAHLRRNAGVNWVGPGGHVINYQLRGGEIFNFVGIVERDWRVESWTERGTREECAADFPGWHADIHTIIRNIAEPYKWALLGREPLTRFSRGRITLLGDAAHPTLPMLAQGANMAIEDGMVLARCLSAFDDPETALARYDAARVERTARLVRGANENAKRFHNPALANASGAQAYVDTEWREDRARGHDRGLRARVSRAGVAVALRCRHGALRRQVHVLSAGRLHGAGVRERGVAVLAAECVRGLPERRRPAVDARIAAACAASVCERSAEFPRRRRRELRVSVSRRARHHSLFP
jgi:salicylate hydroxylase